MLRKRFRYVLSGALLFHGLLFPSPPTQAEILDGQTVATRYIEFYAHGLPGPDATVNSVVGPGTELIGFNGLDVDFSDTNILITTRRDKFYFATLLFEDVYNSIPRFTGVTLNPATSWTGFTQSRISFGANRITIDLALQTALADGEQISLDITAIIPEPATAAMLGLAMLVVGGWARRRSSCCSMNRTATSKRSIPITCRFGSALLCGGFIFGMAVSTADADEDRSWGVSADGLGNVYIAGVTGSSLGGPNAGQTDAFLSKYDATGNLNWSYQLGSNPDISYAHGSMPIARWP